MSKRSAKNNHGSKRTGHTSKVKGKRSASTSESGLDGYGGAVWMRQNKQKNRRKETKENQKRKKMEETRQTTEIKKRDEEK